MKKGTNHQASLKISQEVIEKIATVTALEVEGVAGVSNIVNISGMFSKGLRIKPVTIKIVDGVAEINLALDLNFGTQVSLICEKVQKSVKENVQTMTGIMVSKVNVSVEGISLPNGKQKAKLAEEEAAAEQ